MPIEILVCKECKENFEHPEGEQDWMRKTFGELYAKPRLCKACRGKRRTNDVLNRIADALDGSRKR